MKTFGKILIGIGLIVFCVNFPVMALIAGLLFAGWLLNQIYI